MTDDDYVVRRTKDGWSVYRNGVRVCSLTGMMAVMKWIEDDRAERSAGDQAQQKGK